MMHKIMKGLAPVFAFAVAVGTSGCDANITIGDREGVPLSELDTAGKSPRALVLAGPDTVLVREGNALDIDVAGDPDAVAALRFTLDDDSLGVMRQKGKGRVGKATVTVTLPGLEKVVVAGSGTVKAAALTGRSEVTIAGSGTADAGRVDAEELEVTIAGSGTFKAAGKARKLELTVVGSGNAEMKDLWVETADVTIAGAGDGAFSSNGTVKATVMGSGDVTVRGDAKCTIKSMGSGTLYCERGSQPHADEAPGGPEAPEGTPTPE